MNAGRLVPSGSQRMKFSNTTHLDGQALQCRFTSAVHPWPTDGLDIRIRYSRGSDFSGSCYYATNRLFVNLGRQLTFPYVMETYLARAVSSTTAWWKPRYTIELADAEQLVLFVLLHEYYHWLIKQSGRNPRRKESMCDRYAARVLVDRYQATIRDSSRADVSRREWDFQDLRRFVAPALFRKPDDPRVDRQGVTQSMTPAGQYLLFGT